MLGRLLSTAASTLNPAAYSSSRNTTHLDSVTEEEHTSGLLFPDASLLRQSNANAYPLQATFNSPNASTTGAYDDRGGLELDPVKDFRVIVAQNALGDRDACVLLDTRASSSEPIRGGGPGASHLSSEPSGGTRHARTVSGMSRGSRRGSYMGQSSHANQADARRPTPASQGAFLRARGRSSTLSTTAGDSYQSRHPSDSNDSGLLNCIFGSSAFSYRGSSTKMHIISADDEPEKVAGVPTVSREADSRGASVRNPLSRAYTTGSSSGLPSPEVAPDKKPPSKVTVLLTRMFSVNLPDTGDLSFGARRDSVNSVYQGSLPTESAFPFPNAMKGRKIKEKKTPMYAVAITVQIPLLPRTAARPSSQFSTQGSDYPKLPMSCSLDSAQRWRDGYFEDSMSSASPPASLDERIDLLVDHWDVITRTLSHLEQLARNEILFLLKKVDACWSGPYPKPAKAPNMQRTNQTIVYLPANILSVNSHLRGEALQATRRISRALQTPYVVTGQSRWGVWREEGRCIIRSLGDKEHGFFFLVLITAFLGNHTEWLNFLGPDGYRRRHQLQQRNQQDTGPIVSQRTVIISSDKMTARKLIFLLATFLPARQRLDPLPSPVRADTAAPVHVGSQSPPTDPILRQEKLKDAEGRFLAQQRSDLSDNRGRQRSVSASSNDTTHRWTDGVESNAPGGLLARRRGSDARSVKALHVPIHPTNIRSKKASVAAISTATPSRTVPVPHFASKQSRLDKNGPDAAVADESESLASETLLRNLQRSESSTTGTNGSIPSTAGRWGNALSGLWSSRQGSSMTHTDTGSPESRKRSVSGFTESPSTGQTRLGRMITETPGPTHEDDLGSELSDNRKGISIPNASTNLRGVETELREPSPTADRAKESLLKMSVRADDGVVDVDLPLPGFVSLSSSGDSTMPSPRKPRQATSTSPYAMTSTHSSASAGLHYPQREYDGPNTNVAGWLKTFHEDFLLQATRPYTGLENDIKRAMQAEPTPPVPYFPNAEDSECWVDVATTLIADVRTSTIKRLRLKRKVITGNGLRSGPVSPGIYPSYSVPPRRSSNASIASQFSGFFSNAAGSSRPSPNFADGLHASEAEETFTEEPVVDLDGTLVDAVEQVLQPSVQPSLTHSRTPSPPRNRQGEERSTYESSQREEVPYAEVPRGECRKTVLGALEEVVRSVTAEHCREEVAGEFGAVSDRERRRSLAGTDNTLREGVRRWLLSVEEAW